MLPLIRPATPEEIEAIKDKSDLTMATAIAAMGDPGSEPYIGVVRSCMELDPVFFPADASDTKKALFLWGMMSKLTGMTPEIYFNIHVADEKWRAILEKAGAEPVSTAPEIRYKKVLR